MKKLLLILCLLMSTNAAWAQKKLIHLGWDQPNTKYLRENWQELDKNAPFDGITFEASFTRNNQFHSAYSLMTNRKNGREALQEPLQNLENVRFEKLTSNFIRVHSPVVYIDWFDDAGWEAAIENVADVAWLAKKATHARVKGISFDTETYDAKQYEWRPQDGKSFETVAAQARKRGAQFMKAVGKEYPDITIWSLWLFSKTAMSGEVNASLPANEYGLWPAFVNGWLDELPPQATLVEGAEDAYYFTHLGEFADTYAALKNINSPLLKALLAPENRVKYQTQVSIAFGLYLDAYFDAPGTQFYRGALSPDETRIDRLRKSVSTGLKVADEYVWLYNEQVKWWPIDGSTLPDWSPEGRFTRSAATRPGKGLLAEEASPGITQQLLIGKDARSYAQRLEREGHLSALPERVLNGQFTAGGQPNEAAHWSTWQGDRSHGTMTRDAAVSFAGNDGSAMIAGAKGGTFIQQHDVEVGQLYVVSGWVKKEGQGDATIRIRWQDAARHWNNVDKDVIIVANEATSRNGWQQFFEVLEVPNASTQLVILLQGSGQDSAQDKIWYDNVSLRRLK